MSFATTYFPAHNFLRSGIRHSLIKFLFGGGIRCSLIRSNQKFLTKVFPPRVFEQSLFLFSSRTATPISRNRRKWKGERECQDSWRVPDYCGGEFAEKELVSSPLSPSSSVVAKRQKTILGPYITTAHGKNKDTSKPPPPPPPSVATTYLKKP